jgi:hypothetical protein
MANERLILCGSVSDGSLPFKDPNPLRLRMWGQHRNVHLVIQDVRRAMMKSLPPVFLDLIDIATCVYCADQAVTRGGDGVLDLGENWRRSLFFRVPVRNPTFWKNPSVLSVLVSTLSFLSEDEYYFDFEPLTKEHPLESYLEFDNTPFDGIVEEVVMFSGGIDSLGGAVQEAIIDKRKILLVNHRSSGKLVPRHNRLLELLMEQTKDYKPLHFPVVINKAKNLGREYTQRTRSFLYASLGATIATMIGLTRLRFYENGIVSLNLPPSPQVVGARATRTTHPQVLNGFAQLLTALAGKKFTVENPFLWKTKTEVVRLIGDAGCGKLLKYATSCTRTWEMTKQHTHCGTCSQCIDRRFAVLAAGQEANDPGEAYKVDLLVGAREKGEDRKGDPRTMIAAYLETANDIEKMDALQFFSRFGEASRVLRHLPGNADATAMQVFDLHRRHAKQVTGVIDQAFAKHGAAIRKRELPASCLLRLVYASGPALAPVPSKNREPPLGDNVFRKKGQVWIVRFAGGEDFILLPSKGAAYLHLLLSQPGMQRSAIDLACAVAKNPAQYALSNAGEKSDREALAAYHAKLVELREELQEAKDNNDPGAQERIQGEIESYTQQIRETRGMGGRLRRDSDDRERVRKAVGIAVKRAIKDIGQFDQRLAQHLSAHLICGQNPRYVPPGQDMQWDV